MPISSQLRSHRLFSENWERLAYLVDAATLYHTGLSSVSGEPPHLVQAPLTTVTRGAQTAVACSLPAVRALLNLLRQP